MSRHGVIKSRESIDRWKSAMEEIFRIGDTHPDGAPSSVFDFYGICKRYRVSNNIQTVLREMGIIRKVEGKNLLIIRHEPKHLKNNFVIKVKEAVNAKFGSRRSKAVGTEEPKQNHTEELLHSMSLKAILQLAGSALKLKDEYEAKLREKDAQIESLTKTLDGIKSHF